jgi:hypothetical protein
MINSLSPAVNSTLFLSEKIEDQNGRLMMKLTNDCYLITLHAGKGVEYYYRNGAGWVKQSTRGRKFKATAEQVLNHLLPALSGIKPNVSVNVQHRDLSEAAAEKLDECRGETEPRPEKQYNAT